MTLHCPHDDILFSYAAGTVGESWGVALASHLTFCPKCRETVALGDEIGGILLEDRVPADLDGVVLPIEMNEVSYEVEYQASSSNERSELPIPLRNYVGDRFDDISWQTVGGGVSQFKIDTNDNDQLRLLNITAGKAVPEHGHCGRELTLVLSGSYIDNGVTYGVGDVSDFAEEVVHQPVAGADKDCICIVVTNAPLKFKGIVPRLFQPFVSI